MQELEIQLYQLVLLLGGTVNLLIAFVLVHNNIWYADYDVYRRARCLTAIAMAAFGLGFLGHATFEWRLSWPEGASALTLTYFHIGAVVFGWSHTSLMRPTYPPRSVVVRDLILLMVGITCYWIGLRQDFCFFIFFMHGGYIAYKFYSTYLNTRHNLQHRQADVKPYSWWTPEVKSMILNYHHSFAISCHLIILFGLGGVVITALFPTSIWPFIILMLAGMIVFVYIFYSLTEYGNVIDAATNATEDAVTMEELKRRLTKK
jgi:hypothetical protein